ncbi:apoptosis facilitator Bcl-2-like protein 14 [Denticeps clupeoides]|uniref:Apoptosis facilitator Bcl-2-like protein 14 n=1 Tax=Denticeps clupeoides TaxID=299321 RepID=A0AAY4D6B9_9TELE|nr:apoptosis facilitator Bcl-2-like protein 14 [Denticeps clupeoides]
METSAEATVEFLLLEKYCMRRRAASPPPEIAVFQGLFPAPRGRRLALQSRTSEAAVQGKRPRDVLEDVAEKITGIADSISISPKIASDGDDDSNDGDEDVIPRLVELLRQSGDQLDKEIKKNPDLARFLTNSFSYNLFATITNSFLQRVAPSRAPITQQAQIAMTFEVTRRLSALDLQPMNRVMGFGAQYLQQNFSSWVHQRGGWERAFQEDDHEVQ